MIRNGHLSIMIIYNSTWLILIQWTRDCDYQVRLSSDLVNTKGSVLHIFDQCYHTNFKEKYQKGRRLKFCKLWISNLACCIVAFIVLYCIQIINMNIVQNTYSIFIYKFIAFRSNLYYIGTRALINGEHYNGSTVYIYKYVLGCSCWQRTVYRGPHRSCRAPTSPCPGTASLSCSDPYGKPRTWNMAENRSQHLVPETCHSYIGSKVWFVPQT